MRNVSGIVLPLGGDANRADQGQAREPRGTAHRHLGRDPAAERGADQMHPIEAERLQQVEVEIGEVGDLVEPGRVVRLAETGMLRREDREALGQFVEKRHPAGMPAGAVQEDDRRSVSAARDRRGTAGSPRRRPLSSRYDAPFTAAERRVRPPGARSGCARPRTAPRPARRCRRRCAAASGSGAAARCRAARSGS